jgi:DsbC/DsbD-like thiol-disulfide interchange protein
MDPLRMTSPPLSRSLVAAAAAAILAPLSTGQMASEPEHARARMVAEHTALVPGTTAHLGLSFDIQPGWYMYWHGLNDSGFGAEVRAELPEGFEAGPLLWPAPRRYLIDGPVPILDHVYRGRFTIIMPVKVPEGLEPGSTVRFSARLDWAVCSDACVFEADHVSLSVSIAEPGAEPGRSGAAHLFDEARRRLPLEKPPGDIRLSLEGDALHAEAPGAEYMAFYPLAESRSPADLARDGESRGPVLRVALRPGDKPVSGVLEVRRKETDADGKEDNKVHIVRVRLPRENTGGSDSAGSEMGDGAGR